MYTVKKKVFVISVFVEGKCIKYKIVLILECQTIKSTISVNRSVTSAPSKLFV
jgi:hypothetical protein